MQMHASKRTHKTIHSWQIFKVKIRISQIKVNSMYGTFILQGAPHHTSPVSDEIYWIDFSQVINLKLHIQIDYSKYVQWSE